MRHSGAGRAGGVVSWRGGGAVSAGVSAGGGFGKRGGWFGD